MPRLITEQSFYQYLKCPNWVYFNAHASDKRPHDPLLAKLIDEGLVEEKERELLSDRNDLAEVTAEDPEQAFLQTLAFMREGRQTIYRGVLVDKHWVGTPDVMERVEGHSRFGSYYYVAADMKRARSVHDEFKFQGCFYAELLRKVQGVRPQQGYVLTPDGVVLSYPLEPFSTEYKLTLDEIEAIVAGRKRPHFVTSGCKQSPWFADCRDQAVSCDDLSLLNRVWEDEVARLEKAGFKTIRQLADASLERVERLVPDVRSDRLEHMHRQAIALRDHRHTLIGHADLPTSKIELHFDIESDPLRDFDYLFGVLVVDGSKETYLPFLAEYPDQEAANWQAFVACIEQYHDAPIYHYGWFETEVVRRFTAKYGASAIAQEAFERNMVDLLAVVRSSVIFPLTFYSLKDIGSYIGFSWRAEDATGANSVLWFEEWLRHKDPVLREKILAYNEDDCRATLALTRWLRRESSML